MTVTLSVIKADIGGFPGHSTVHSDLIAIAQKKLEEAKKSGLLIDYHVTNCGDDLELIMTHRRGRNNEEIHKLAWDVFIAGTGVAKGLKLYGAGQDLLKDSFSGNVKGAGPGVAEMEFEERKSEPVIIFMADKTEPGSWNFPLYKMFADPFNTSGLVIDPSMKDGFIFEIHDVMKHMRIKLHSPTEIYEILALIGSPDRYVVKRIWRKSDNEIAAASSTQRLNFMAGRYIGKDDPVTIVRCQSGFPALGEVLEPFTFPYLVAGWMRGSHNGPIMPVPLKHSKCTRFDGPPRIIALGFQIADGRLIGPVDLFDDVAFDHVREKSSEIANYMRMHGPFEPHRLSEDKMEYTSMPHVMEKIKSKMEPMKKKPETSSKPETKE